MPIYDFRCPNCDTLKVDVLVKRWDDPVLCPNCNGGMLREPGYFHMRGFPRIPKNHLPKSKGGDFDPKGAYWK